MEDAIVLYPSPAIGHLIAMVELGKLLLTRYPSLSVKILITTPPYDTGSTAPYINRVSATNNSITFHRLPTISLPPSVSPLRETLSFELHRLNNPHVHQALVSISETSAVRAIFMDFFCTPALSVAAELNVPAYFFMTPSASNLAAFFYLPFIHRNTTKSLKDLDINLDIPGLPPIPAGDMPNPILDRNDKAYECFFNVSTQLPKSAGIIVNTYELLEPRVVKAISDGLCVPDGRTPPLYCIGPLIASDDQTGGDVGSHACLSWLNSQPSRSVVLLCFGSRGLFSTEQLKEMAIGFVSAAEVEKRVKELMDSEEGNSVRMQVLKMKAAAMAAMSEGGSSRVALSNLVESWTRG
ncbi:hypothetical protein RHGRI_008589 [Rhododendron griersonianum]|uniref:Uncharacterized protein n=1 Tax=Rhododendron griersonianum TaxID=479676 RepID=A0AAV6L0V2_9ERIC|nr:hypothetical protein RHGRI_008589 [Rhododendron griersonianum]